MNTPAARRDARRAALDALLAFVEDRDARILTKLDWRNLAPRDHRLAREIALGVVRRRDLLDHVCAGFTPRGLPPRIETRFALRIGAYQLMFLDRIPVHASVAETVELCEGPSRGFVNAVLRRIAEHIGPTEETIGPKKDRVALPHGRVLTLGAPLPDPEANPVDWLCVMGSLPREFVERWLARHGREKTFEMVAAANRPAGVTMRTVRVTREQLAERLAAEGVVTEPGVHERILRWIDGSSPFTTAPYHDGWFVAQNVTALRAALAVDAQPGETILDLCAAPGTKATLLAEAVGETGRVLAYDPDSKRRIRIVENVLRLRLPWLKIIEDPERGAGADRVLADVPCSNTGVLARRVEARYRLDRERIDSLVTLQRQILHTALRLVKPGGRVVYSTCSIEEEENQGVVAAVAAELGVTVEAEVATWPDLAYRDGGYYAVLRAPGGSG